MRKIPNSCRSVTTRGFFGSRRVRLVYYGAFRRIFSGLGGSDDVVKVVTVRGAVTKDLLRGCRLLESDKTAVVKRRGLQVDRDVVYLPKRS